MSEADFASLIRATVAAEAAITRWKQWRKRSRPRREPAYSLSSLSPSFSGCGCGCRCCCCWVTGRDCSSASRSQTCAICMRTCRLSLLAIERAVVRHAFAKRRYSSAPVIDENAPVCPATDQPSSPTIVPGKNQGTVKKQIRIGTSGNKTLPRDGARNERTLSRLLACPHVPLHRHAGQRDRRTKPLF